MYVLMLTLSSMLLPQSTLSTPKQLVYLCMYWCWVYHPCCCHSQPYLPLYSKYTYVCTDVDFIIHAAATVNLIYPYTVSIPMSVLMLTLSSMLLPQSTLSTPYTVSKSMLLTLYSIITLFDVFEISCIWKYYRKWSICSKRANALFFIIFSKVFKT